MISKLVGIVFTLKNIFYIHFMKFLEFLDCGFTYLRAQDVNCKTLGPICYTFYTKVDYSLIYTKHMVSLN
jgi:hypothetical protein